MMIGKLVFYVYLMLVTMQDVKSMKVTRLLHVLGVIGVAILFVEEAKVSISIISVVTFMIIQLCCYCMGCFGLADLFLFVNCSLYIAIMYEKEEVLLYLFFFQLVANILLILSQLCVGNLQKGKLKQKVAYIPYLSTAFILTNIVL